MIPCLSQVCSLESPFEKDVEDYSAGQCAAIEIWLTKLETYLKNHTVEQVRQLFQEHGVTAPVASFQGGLLVGEGLAKEETWDHFRRRLDLCRQLEIGVLVVACDTSGQLTQQDIDRVQSALAQAAEEAQRRQVRLALEFQARATFGNNLQTAAALVEQVGSPHLGICLDLFHFYVGPSKSEDLDYLTKENLFHVQLCDLADLPRELAADGNRILPGEGDIPVLNVVKRLQSLEYEGAVSIELMNPNIWRIPALQFGEIGMTSLRKNLGLADMGR